MDFDFNKDLIVLLVWLGVSLAIIVIGTYFERSRRKNKIVPRGATRIQKGEKK